MNVYWLMVYLLDIIPWLLLALLVLGLMLWASYSGKGGRK